MTQEQFIQHIESLELKSKNNPQSFRLLVIIWALLGYLVIAGIGLLSAVIAIVLAIICIKAPILLLKLAKIIWLPFLVVYDVGRALLFRFPAPQGHSLDLKNYPALAKEIEKIQEKTGIYINEVLLVPDFNAAVLVQPRFGLFGFNKTYLILGFSLLATLNIEQLRSVLAHEFGHLSAGDSQLAGRIYRMRLLWATLYQRYSEGSAHGWIIKKFVDWFWPHFNAYALVMGRQQEYAADNMAAQMTSPQTTADALIVTAISAPYQVESFWQPIYEQAKEVDSVEKFYPYTQLLTNPVLPTSQENLQTLLDKALKEKTSFADTHPSLADRIKFLNQLPSMKGFSQDAAIKSLFPDPFAISKILDKEWQAQNAERWREYYLSFQQDKQQLQQLQQAQNLEQEQKFELAVLTERVYGVEAAISLYKQCYQDNPQHGGVCFYLGKALLNQKDKAGLALLDQAITLDMKAIKPSAELAYQFLMDLGEVEQAEQYLQHWQNQHTMDIAAEQERSYFNPTDSFSMVQWEQEPLDKLIILLDSIKGVDGIRKAYIVEKNLTYYAEHPIFLLYLETAIFAGDNAKKDMLRKLQKYLPDNVAVIFHESQYKALLKAIKAVKGSCILS